jgi:hypothetical protein
MELNDSDSSASSSGDSDVDLIEYPGFGYDPGLKAALRELKKLREELKDNFDYEDSLDIQEEDMTFTQLDKQAVRLKQISWDINRWVTYLKLSGQYKTNSEIYVKGLKAQKRCEQLLKLFQQAKEASLLEALDEIESRSMTSEYMLNPTIKRKLYYKAVEFHAQNRLRYLNKTKWNPYVFMLIYSNDFGDSKDADLNILMEFFRKSLRKAIKVLNDGKKPKKLTFMMDIGFDTKPGDPKSTHANTLIFNLKFEYKKNRERRNKRYITMSWSRFEPWGRGKYNVLTHSLEDILAKINFAQILAEPEFQELTDYFVFEISRSVDELLGICPGPQIKYKCEEKLNMLLKEDGSKSNFGFCAAWSLFFIYMRLLNFTKDLDDDELAKLIVSGKDNSIICNKFGEFVENLIFIHVSKLKKRKHQVLD